MKCEIEKGGMKVELEGSDDEVLCIIKSLISGTVKEAEKRMPKKKARESEAERKLVRVKGKMWLTDSMLGKGCTFESVVGERLSKGLNITMIVDDVLALMKSNGFTAKHTKVRNRVKDVAKKLRAEVQPKQVVAKTIAPEGVLKVPAVRIGKYKWITPAMLGGRSMEKIVEEMLSLNYKRKQIVSYISDKLKENNYICERSRIRRTVDRLIYLRNRRLKKEAEGEMDDKRKQD